MESTPFAGLDRLGQINIRVHDLARAVAFYRDVLGLKFLFEFPNLAFFDCGGIRILLDVPEDKKFDHPSSILYFRVEDLQGSTEGLRRRGARIVSEPHRIAPMPDHDLWMSFFEDSEGNTLALMSEVPRVS